MCTCFLIGSHTIPGQRRIQPTPTSLGQGCMRVLGVTCHLHFWQSDRGLLLATAVTQGVERTPNKSQYTKLTLEKKILPPLLPGFELATFRSRIHRSTDKLSRPSMWRNVHRNRSPVHAEGLGAWFAGGSQLANVFLGVLYLGHLLRSSIIT